MKYVLMYVSRPDLEAAVPPERQQEVYAQIYAWFGEHGSVIADNGAELQRSGDRDHGQVRRGRGGPGGRRRPVLGGQGEHRRLQRHRRARPRRGDRAGEDLAVAGPAGCLGRDPADGRGLLGVRAVLPTGIDGRGRRPRADRPGRGRSDRRLAAPPDRRLRRRRGGGAGGGGGRAADLAQRRRAGQSWRLVGADRPPAGDRPAAAPGPGTAPGRRRRRGRCPTFTAAAVPAGPAVPDERLPMLFGCCHPVARGRGPARLDARGRWSA